METTSINSSTEHHVNHAHGEAFILLIDQTPISSDPSGTEIGEVCFCYIKNTSDTDMCLEEVNFRLAGTAQAEVIKVRGMNTGNPIGGTTVTPNNLNLGSGKTASGTFLVGSEITGLTDGNEYDRVYVGSSNDISNFNFGQDIIVPKGNVVTLWATNLDVAIYVGLLFNYHSVDIG